jgi:serine-type D-Ala-D-Ala carboxypeptidase/endopeptidase
MNKLITLSVIIPLLFLVAPKVYADSKHCDRDGWPACYEVGHYKGAIDASFDYNDVSFGNMSKSHNIPVNESTIFHIGSITKAFTTLLLADMVKQGIVNLNDPIEKYLPTGVRVPDYKGHKITIEELATHTSGLPEFPSNYGVFLPKARILDPNYNPNNYTAKQLYQALSNFTLTSEPGSKYRYSNFGLGLLGHILSLKAGGIPYEQLVTEKILNVLGMHDA